jgi:hypothetical protein
MREIADEASSRRSKIRCHVVRQIVSVQTIARHRSLPLAPLA